MAIPLLAWALGRLDFFKPLWLLGLLAIPFFGWLAVTGIAGLPPRTNTFSVSLRVVLYTLLVLCLADPQIVLLNDSLCTLFLLDHSASVPEQIAEKQLKYANAAAATKGRKDTAGLVVFGANSSVEVMPVKDLKVERIYSAVNKQHTDLQKAIELATAAFPAEARKKIVLITDGNENLGDALAGVRFAAGNGVVTEVLPVDYAYEKEVLVEKIVLPENVREEEPFDLKVHVQSERECQAVLTIYRNGVEASRQDVALVKGRNTFRAALKIKEPGFYAYTARISTAQDTIPDNNEASGYVYIQGASRVLLVAPSTLEVQNLAEACREANLEADMVGPEGVPESLAMLQNHDCVVLANVGSESFSEDQMKMLRAAVRDVGIGLVMIGGENSFGAGGYQDTPIEEALPVSMEISQKKVNPKGALVLILHTCEFADGNYWAKQIAKKAIETVNPQDEVGVLLYGGREEWLFPLRPAEDKTFMYNKINAANPGDMPSFQPTLQLAFDGLSRSDAMVKHVIMISDGDPSKPTPELIKEMAAAGISISTVAINPHSPRDVDVLKYIAMQTGGRYYSAEDPRALPQIFVKEAKVVKRSLIFNKKFQPLLVMSSELVKGITPQEVPPLMAYVATTPKPRALVPMVSDNENHDPVFAYWHYGLGKAVAFTGDASPNWGKEWVSWDKYSKFWTQTIQWVSRKRRKMNLKIRTEMEGDTGKLVIDAVDRQGKFMNFLKLNGRMVNPLNEGTSLDIRQTAPGRYEGEFRADRVGVNILNIGFIDPQSGDSGFVAAGISVPYSPEYLRLRSNAELLRLVSAAGGGRVLSGDAKRDRVFQSAQPPTRTFRPVWEPLVLLAILLFFIDVTVRRVVITPNDMAAVYAAVRGRLSFRRSRGPHDKTMAALLSRKKKTFQRAGAPGDPAAPTPGVPAPALDFKKKLSQDATQTAPGKLELAEPSAPAAMQEKNPAEGGAVRADEGGKEGAAGDYTGRLLAAKKRAKKPGA